MAEDRSAATLSRFEEFKLAVHRALGENPEWRYGQACFNVLTEFDPELAERLRGGDYDPFYSDGRVPNFNIQLQVAWAK